MKAVPVSTNKRPRPAVYSEDVGWGNRWIVECCCGRKVGFLHWDAAMIVATSVLLRLCCQSLLPPKERRKGGWHQ